MPETQIMRIDSPIQYIYELYTNELIHLYSILMTSHTWPFCLAGNQPPQSQYDCSLVLLDNLQKYTFVYATVCGQYLYAPKERDGEHEDDEQEREEG